jgi:hypothetical protein
MCCLNMIFSHAGQASFTSRVVFDGALEKAVLAAWEPDGFKLIDGWHIAVSQPVHNPAALAIERAKAAAALLPPGPMYIDNAVARTSAVFADAGALSDKELLAAKAEKDICGAVSNGYAYIDLLKLCGGTAKLTLCE